MDAKEIFDKLKSVFENGITDLKVDIPIDPYIAVSSDVINAVSLFLRDEESLQFDSLSCLSGVDFDKDNLAVVYHLYSFALNHKVCIKVILPKEKPEVNTVCDVWATAEWHEREAYDMYGIIFLNHPDLRRILCPEDWEGFPLRKDYKVQEFYNGMKVPY
jgi:NADH-quinone oxidoreductase subunit C